MQTKKLSRISIVPLTNTKLKADDILLISKYSEMSNPYLFKSDEVFIRI